MLVAAPHGFDPSAEKNHYFVSANCNMFQLRTLYCLLYSSSLCLLDLELFSFLGFAK